MRSIKVQLILLSILLVLGFGGWFWFQNQKLKAHTSRWDQFLEQNAAVSQLVQAYLQVSHHRSEDKRRSQYFDDRKNFEAWLEKAPQVLTKDHSFLEKLKKSYSIQKPALKAYALGFSEKKQTLLFADLLQFLHQKNLDARFLILQNQKRVQQEQKTQFYFTIGAIFCVLLGSFWLYRLFLRDIRLVAKQLSNVNQTNFKPKKINEFKVLDHKLQSVLQGYRRLVFEKKLMLEFLKQSQNLVFLVDENHKILRINQQVETLCQQEGYKIRGKSFLGLVKTQSSHFDIEKYFNELKLNEPNEEIAPMAWVEFFNQKFHWSFFGQSLVNHKDQTCFLLIIKDQTQITELTGQNTQLKQTNQKLVSQIKILQQNEAEIKKSHAQMADYWKKELKDIVTNQEKSLPKKEVIENLQKMEFLFTQSEADLAPVKNQVTNWLKTLIDPNQKKWWNLEELVLESQKKIGSKHNQPFTFDLSLPEGVVEIYLDSLVFKKALFQTIDQELNLKNFKDHFFISVQHEAKANSGFWHLYPLSKPPHDDSLYLWRKLDPNLELIEDEKGCFCLRLALQIQIQHQETLFLDEMQMED